MLRVPVPFAAAVMLAWREVRSRIIFSFTSCLSAWTVWACWRRLSSLEKCFPQWQLNGRSPVCFLTTANENQDVFWGAAGDIMVPDVSREMLASAEDHSTVAIPPALEGFGRGGTITLVDPSTSDVGDVVDWQLVWMRWHRGGGRGRDDGGHGSLVLVGVQGGLNLHLPLCRTTRDPPLKGAWLRHRKLSCKTRRSLNLESISLDHGPFR